MHLKVFKNVYNIYSINNCLILKLLKRLIFNNISILLQLIFNYPIFINIYYFKLYFSLIVLWLYILLFTLAIFIYTCINTITIFY
jgi:hypothetical protein